MPKDKHGVPSLREMVVSKTYPGAPAGIQITVFPTRSASHPDKFSLFSSTQNAYFGKLRDTFQEAVEGANKENIRMYGKPEVPREPVKGEQAGMLGVSGKVHTQKQPYKAGQMEFGSYTKYKEAMPSESDLHWKTVAELKQSCSQRGLPTTGSKEDLIRRLK